MVDGQAGKGDKYRPLDKFAEGYDKINWKDCEHEWDRDYVLTCYPPKYKCKKCYISEYCHVVDNDKDFKNILEKN